MSLNDKEAALLGSALLGIAMGALVLGFALFFLPTETAINTPRLWVFALSTTFAVALCSEATRSSKKRA